MKSRKRSRFCRRTIYVDWQNIEWSFVLNTDHQVYFCFKSMKCSKCYNLPRALSLSSTENIEKISSINFHVYLVQPLNMYQQIRMRIRYDVFILQISTAVSSIFLTSIVSIKTTKYNFFHHRFHSISKKSLSFSYFYHKQTKFQLDINRKLKAHSRPFTSTFRF